MTINHTALYVQDLEVAKAFYEEFFGGRAGHKYHNPKTGFESYFLRFDSGAALELMRKAGVAGRPEEARAGWAHISFSAGSEAAVDELTARLAAAGYPPIDGPRRTGDGYYESALLDPEGNRVEITV